MTKRNSRPAVLYLRKLKGKPRTNLLSLGKARLRKLIEQSINKAAVRSGRVPAVGRAESAHLTTMAKRLREARVKAGLPEDLALILWAA
jgi:hypothetical protein